MAHLPPITPHLVRRFEDVMRALNLAAIRNLQALPDNPFGFDISTWGQAVANAARDAAGAGWWNRAVGLEMVDESALDEIVALFEERVPCWHTSVAPEALREAVGQRLAARGLYPAHYDTVLYGLAEPPGRVTMTGLVMREIEPDEVDFFAELWAAGCDLVIGHTGFGGQSQYNEERLGLRVAYTPVTWTKASG